MRAHRNFSRAGPRGYRNTASAETQRGCQWAKPPETESFEAFAHLKKAKKIAANMSRPSEYGTGSLQTDATVTKWPTLVPPFCLTVS